MKQVVIIGSGLSALSCAIALAEQGIRAVIASPYPSERAQSVMAVLKCYHKSTVAKYPRIK